MWGYPERAASLQGNDPLATLLFQISSPAHIPWGDSRWQELLHGYDVWVHMEDSGENNSSAILIKACKSMTKHAGVSSNLAALSLHVTRMLRKMVREIQKMDKTTETDEAANNISGTSKTDEFSRRISLVGKARATAGALQLLRLLAHRIVVNTGKDSKSDSRLEEALLYRTRGDISYDQPTGRPLVNAILDFISVTGAEGTKDVLETPEIYDAVVLSFHLLFVLMGTQLYQPFVSSFQCTDAASNHIHCILEELFQEEAPGEVAVNYRLFDASSRSSFSATSGSHRGMGASFRRRQPSQQQYWTAKSVLAACLSWQARRPRAPERSLAHYYYTMAKAAVAARGGQTMGQDGMYESHLVVQATAPQSGSYVANSESSNTLAVGENITREIMPHRSQSMILDATKGVFVLGSSIILLPFRLMSLVFGVLASQKNRNGREDTFTKKFKTSNASSRTKDVLWLSESILSDLGSCLILLLVNNNRNRPNSFRTQLSRLVDNRWDQDVEDSQVLPDLPKSDDESLSVGELGENGDEKSDLTASRSVDDSPLTVNFENLFALFGRSLHNEVGSLMLYTLFQTCPSLAESLAARSDLDTLVLPLLRTLYFSSSSSTYTASDYSSRKQSTKSNTKMNTRNCPFRSRLQLYVIIILLLLFSQDSSFGRDAFRRISVSRVQWYKERNLKNINLGSVLLLTLLRSLMFNLQRLKDVFLLSNCCAILQNLAPSVVDLHEYAAMRVASITVSVLKKHLKLHSQSAGESTKEEVKSNASDVQQAQLSTPLGMYEEVAHTLLDIIQHCLSSRSVARNLHLVYALVYHQSELISILKAKKLYSSRLTDRILSIVREASDIVQEAGARTATKALNVLDDQVEQLQRVAEKKRNKKHAESFNFTYEEEADPEGFFVPYVWETIVCVVTSSSIEWKKDHIQVFDILEPEAPEATDIDIQSQIVATSAGEYSKTVDEMV